MRSFVATAENSGYQQSEGLMSYYAGAAINWVGENVPAVARWFPYASEDVTTRGESLTAHLTTPHPAHSAEPAHTGDDHIKKTYENAGMFIAFLKLLTARHPESVSTETWTEFGTTVRAMAAGAHARLFDRMKPKPRGRRLTHGDGD